MLKLAVGLPVFNGENFLAATLEALRKQTTEDLVIVVSDNASTDSTPSILAGAASSEERFEIIRQQHNLGAAPNYNAVLRQAPPSQYFAWVAHDDVPQPRFLERCAAALDAHPAAVLAFSTTALIDADGTVIGELPSRPQLTSQDPVIRLGDILQQTSNHPIFGVIRRSALDRTRLHGSYTGSDRTLLVELALLGPFVELPEPLFHLREHQDRSVRRGSSNDHQIRAAWFDSSREGKLVFPHWRRVADYLRAVTSTPLDAAERIRCLGKIARIVAGPEGKKLVWDLIIAGRQLAAGNAA